MTKWGVAGGYGVGGGKGGHVIRLGGRAAMSLFRVPVTSAARRAGPSAQILGRDSSGWLAVCLAHLQPRGQGP